MSYDNPKIGFDANADNDADDVGDTKLVDDDFASTTMSLTYDDALDTGRWRQGQAGNLTDDGLFKFVYGARNRLAAAKTRYTSSTTQVTIGTYAYVGATRRVSKTVTNQGAEVVANDGGSTNMHFYFQRPASAYRAASTDNR